jgi:hypothetical protein
MVFASRSYSLLLHIVSIRASTFPLNCYYWSTWVISDRQIQIQCACPICSYTIQRSVRTNNYFFYFTLLCDVHGWDVAFIGAMQNLRPHSSRFTERETHSLETVAKSSFGYLKFYDSRWSVKDLVMLCCGLSISKIYFISSVAVVFNLGYAYPRGYAKTS